MDNSVFFMLLITLRLLISPQLIATLDVVGSEEGDCFKVNSSTKVDLNWASSVKRWNFPIMGRYNLYQIASLILSKPAEEIQEDDLYYHSCITIDHDIKRNASTIYGFKNHSFTFRFSYSEGMESIKYYDPSGKTLLATCNVVLTDNITYFVEACCFLGTTQMSWWAASVPKYLPPKTVNFIYDHMEKIGFSRKQFTGTRYESC